MAMRETAAEVAALGREGLVFIIRMETDADRIFEMFVLGNKLADMHTEEWKPSVISVIKEGQDDDPEQPKYIMLYRQRAALELDIMQATCREAIDIVENQLLPFSRAGENTVLCTNTKADAYSFWTMHKMEDIMQLHFEATSKAGESLSPVHVLQHALHFTKTALSNDVKEWPESATALAMLALHKAGLELASLDGGSYKKIADTIGVMEEDLKTAEIMELTYEKLKFCEPTSLSSKDYFRSEEPSENYIWLEQEPSYSGGSWSFAPAPVVPLLAGPPVPPNVFISPGDWGSEVNKGLASREMRFRKKEAKIKRGFMG